MNKVLIITYYWPPSGGAGVQRWLKFSKYLPEFGWEPVILTVDPDYATYPAIDPSLEKDVPASIEVFRTKATDWFRFYKSDKSKIPSGGFASNKDNSFKGKFFRFIRGNLFIPDPRRGWNRFAFKKACEIIDKENIKHIITTSPPHSTQLIGLKLKRRLPKLKWICDFRDPWTDIYYYRFFFHTSVAKYIDSCYEKKVMRKADRIISVGKTLAEMTASKIKDNASKIHIISNGFDEEDFRDIQITDPQRFTLTYTGTISEAYPLDALINALNKLKERGYDFLLRFVGTIPDTIKNQLTDLISPQNVEFIGSIPHPEAVKYMISSSVLLLLIPEHESARAIITGKIFEYIATGKPVLFIGPVDGDAADYLRQCGHTGIFSGKDDDEILRFLESTMKSAGSFTTVKNSEFLRSSLAGKLAGVLNKI